MEHRHLAAVQAWRTAIGDEHVCADLPELDEAETATFVTTQRVVAILRPADRLQVQTCLRIATTYATPVYPLSGAGNWGYGSRVPPRDGCAILDLSRLNRILDYDERLAYVTIEPGVTQGQLYEFLQARGGRLWLDATGASPEASVVGNTLERGFGHTPYSQHISHCANLEVVLPSGEVIETGLGRFGNAHAAPVYAPGLGPALDGLFAQSGLGIVTRMTVWLMPAPEYVQGFSFRVDTPEQLPALVDALVPLRLDGTLRSAVHMGNAYKLLASLRQYPWAEMDGRTPLAPELLQRYREALTIGAWNGLGALYGTRRQVAAARERVLRALRGIARPVQLFDDRTLALGRLLAGPYRRFTGVDLTALLPLVEPVFGLLKGVPSTHGVGSAYWRKRTPPPRRPDPNRDKCGLILCAPVAPLSGRHAVRLDAIITDTLLEGGFEPIIALTLRTERSLGAVVAISYDRETPGEDARARVCAELLRVRLAEGGYYPYRLDIQAQSDPGGAPAYLQVLGALKAALDPRQILAPGRYFPPQPAAQALEVAHDWRR